MVLRTFCSHAAHCEGRRRSPDCFILLQELGYIYRVLRRIAFDEVIAAWISSVTLTLCGAGRLLTTLESSKLYLSRRAEASKWCC